MDEPRRPARRRNTTQDRLRALEERLAQLEPAPQVEPTHGSQAGRSAPESEPVRRQGAGLGHELRTALEGLLGAVTLLRQSRLDARACGHVQEVERCCGSALSALDEALELAAASGNALEDALALREDAARPPAAPTGEAWKQNPNQPLALNALGVGGRPRVLVAEDNEVNRRVAERLLERMGAETTCVENGSAALSAWDAGRFDLVIMDCDMPVLDGYAAARELRRRERARGLPRTPVLALTASCTAEDRLRCFEAGMDDFLAKPTPTQVLLGKLQEWLPSLAPQA